MSERKPYLVCYDFVMVGVIPETPCCSSCGEDGGCTAWPSDQDLWGAWYTDDACCNHAKALKALPSSIWQQVADKRDDPNSGDVLFPTEE